MRSGVGRRVNCSTACSRNLMMRAASVASGALCTSRRLMRWPPARAILLATECLLYLARTCTSAAKVRALVGVQNARMKESPAGQSGGGGGTAHTHEFVIGNHTAGLEWVANRSTAHSRCTCSARDHMATSQTTCMQMQMPAASCVGGSGCPCPLPLPLSPAPASPPHLLWRSRSRRVWTAGL